MIVLVQVIIHVYNLRYDLSIVAYIDSTIIQFIIVVKYDEYLENIGGLNNNSLCNILNTIDENNINQYNVNHMTIRHSPYLDGEAFKSFIKNKHNGFAVISTNIASIRSKYDELQIFTQE